MQLGRDDFVSIVVLGTFSNLLQNMNRVPSSWIRLTSNYNFFFIFNVEQDTDLKVKLKTHPFVHNSKPSLRNSCMDLLSPDMLNHLRSHPIHKNTCSTWVLVPGTHRYFFASPAMPIMSYTRASSLSSPEGLVGFRLMSKWFRFGFLQQIQIPNEYRALPSESTQGYSLFKTPN